MEEVDPEEDRSELETSTYFESDMYPSDPVGFSINSEDGFEEEFEFEESEINPVVDADFLPQ